MTLRSTLILALTGLSLVAQAQPASSAASGIQTSTDPARAAAIEQKSRELRARAASQPAIFFRGKTDAGWPVLSGGITVGDRETMQAERGQYSLWVATVAKPSGAYLADVKLRIVRQGDKTVVLERTMEGPWLFVALPPGGYDVTATFKAESNRPEQTATQRVTVPRNGQRQAVFRFASDAEVSPDMVSPYQGNPFGTPTAKK